MIPVSLRHEDSEVLEANCTITKDYQIISGDESFLQDDWREYNVSYE